MARPDYPPTAVVDQIDDYHGVRVADPYRWLEDLDAPEVTAWVGEQQAFTQRWLDAVPARGDVRRRLRELWDHARAGAPWRRGARWFQLRNDGLQDQDVLFVMASPTDAGRVLVDPNTLSEDGTVALTGLAVSHDGCRIAYALSEAGSDWMTWRVREVADPAGAETHHDHDDALPWSKFAGAAWTRDGQELFYARYDAPAQGEEHEAPNREHRLLRHRLGDDPVDDEVVLARPDRPQWILSPWVSDDGRWLVVTISEGTDPRARIHVADLDGGGEVVPLLDDFDAAYEVVGVHDGALLVITDRDAPMRRVLAVGLPGTSAPAERQVLAEGADRIEQARLVGGRLAVVTLHHAASRLALHDLQGRHAPEGVDLGDLGSIGSLSGRPDDDALHLTFTTFTRPTSVHRHDLATGLTSVIFEPAAGVDAGAFTTEQVFVPADDGAQVPMFLIRRRDVAPTATAPALLYGYGGFDIALTPRFSVSWMVWLERGGVLAVANLRGGGEYGRDWHDAGRLANKQRVFDDAFACAEWLVEHRWTTADRLAIQGGSNGGLLVGACLTQRPELFGACVAEVGVLDMLRFHRFTIGWAWTSDYGSSDDPEQFRWLHAYSPLHNVRPGTAYPPTLIVTGDHDDRVVPGHSYKFAAALQAAQDAEAPILLRVETSAGHGAGTPVSKLVDERADVLAFLEATVGPSRRPASLGWRGGSVTA